MNPPRHSQCPPGVKHSPPGQTSSRALWVQGDPSPAMGLYGAWTSVDLMYRGTLPPQHGPYGWRTSVDLRFGGRPPPLPPPSGFKQVSAQAGPLATGNNYLSWQPGKGLIGQQEMPPQSSPASRNALYHTHDKT